MVKFWSKATIVLYLQSDKEYNYKMKTENIDLLNFCKFYKGEDRVPRNLVERSDFSFFFWEAEKKYVDAHETAEEKELIDTYVDLGLANANEDLPMSLCASLFSIFCKGADNDPLDLAKYFQQMFLQDYLALDK